jgi:hypothetical protein
MLLKCKVSAIVAIGLMTLGTFYDHPAIRAWSILVGLLAVGIGIGVAVQRGAESIKAYVHRWTLETFEHGFKQGVEQGREMEAAERMMQIVRQYREN